MSAALRRSCSITILNGTERVNLRTIFAQVCKDFDVEMIECNGEDEHVHRLIVYPPKVALSKLINSLKGVSSRLLREWRRKSTVADVMKRSGRLPISSDHAAARRCR